MSLFDRFVILLNVQVSGKTISQIVPSLLPYKMHLQISCVFIDVAVIMITHSESIVTVDR